MMRRRCFGLLSDPAFYAGLRAEGLRKRTLGGSDWEPINDSVLITQTLWVFFYLYGCSFIF
jgi:hypothetical protein